VVEVILVVGETAADALSNDTNPSLAESFNSGLSTVSLGLC
jgi:hypothetical protein